MTLKLHDKYTVRERLSQFGSAVATRLVPHFQQAGTPFPPKAITLLAFKDSKQLELYVRGNQHGWHKVRDYPIEGASGGMGPKLCQGDHQVPEGVYTIELLNPNSQFHVALRLNYPNGFDQKMAKNDGRQDLGGDIMIHGKNQSVGCLAMGDEAAEDLFALTAWVGKDNVKVVIAPTDFRRNALPVALPASLPAWVYLLYQTLRLELTQYPL